MKKIGLKSAHEYTRECFPSVDSKVNPRSCLKRYFFSPLLSRRGEARRREGAGALWGGHFPLTHHLHGVPDEDAEAAPGGGVRRREAETCCRLAQLQLHGPVAAVRERGPGVCYWQQYWKHWKRWPAQERAVHHRQELRVIRFLLSYLLPVTHQSQSHRLPDYLN